MHDAHDHERAPYRAAVTREPSSPRARRVARPERVAQRARWRATTLFFVAALTIALGTTSSRSWAQSQTSDAKTAIVQFEPGNAARDGYESATVEVLYRFRECFGSVALLHVLKVATLRAHRHYWLDGQRYEVPDSIAPKLRHAVEFSGRVMGVAPRDFATTSTTGGSSCMDGVTLAPFSAYWPKDSPSEKKLFVLNGLSVATAAAGYRAPALRDPAVERFIRGRKKSKEPEEAKPPAPGVVPAQPSPSAPSAPKSPDSPTPPRAGEADPGAGTAPAPGSPSQPAAAAPATSPSPDASAGGRQDGEPSPDPAATGAPPVGPPRADASGEKAVEQYLDFFKDMQARGSERARERAQEEEREARRAALRAEELRAEREAECRALQPFTLPDPSFHVPAGKAFTGSSRWCRNGSYVPEWDRSRDVYVLELAEPQTLRFLLAGPGNHTTLALSEAGNPSRLKSGSHFVASLRPGRYTLVVERDHLASETLESSEAPYYLRVLTANRCWTDAAVAVHDGATNVDVAKSTCSGPQGQPAIMFRLDYGGDETRDIDFVLRGHRPVLMVLGGHQTRLLRLAYDRAEGSVSTAVRDALPEPIFILVAADASAPASLTIHTRIVGFSPEFVPVFNMGGGATFTTRGDAAAHLNIGFSLGAQVHPLVGVSALIQGAVGGGSVRGRADTFGWGMFGIGGHVGSTRNFVRLTPGLLIVERGEEGEALGPAMRLDMVLSPETGSFGFAPFVQVGQIEDHQSVSLGITAAVLRSPPEKRGSDE